MAAKWRTHCGQGLGTRPQRSTQGGHKADTLGTQSGQELQPNTMRTHSGQASGARPEPIAASLFFPKREPLSKLLGEKEQLVLYGG